MDATVTKIDICDKISKATEKARDEYKMLLEKANCSIDKILAFPFKIEKQHDEIKISNELAAVNMNIDGEETKFQGIKFVYTKTLHAHTKNYVTIRIEYSFGVNNGGMLTVIDKIEDVDTGKHQYNMAEFELTKTIFDKMHKLGLLVLNY